MTLFWEIKIDKVDYFVCIFNCAQGGGDVVS